MVFNLELNIDHSTQQPHWIDWIKFYGSSFFPPQEDSHLSSVDVCGGVEEVVHKVIVTCCVVYVNCVASHISESWWLRSLYVLALRDLFSAGNINTHIHTQWPWREALHVAAALKQLWGEISVHRQFYHFFLWTQRNQSDWMPFFMSHAVWSTKINVECLIFLMWPAASSNSDLFRFLYNSSFSNLESNSCGPFLSPAWSDTCLHQRLTGALYLLSVSNSYDQDCSQPLCLKGQCSEIVNIHILHFLFLSLLLHPIWFVFHCLNVHCSTTGHRQTKLLPYCVRVWGWVDNKVLSFVIF